MLKPSVLVQSCLCGPWLQPPLFLGASAFFAAKDAIAAARAEVGHPATAVFRLDSPATVERIRMACEDQFTARIPVSDGPVKRWNVRA